MNKDEWIYRREVARLLPCSYPRVPAVAAANNIRRLEVPGSYPKYHKGDVLDLAAASIHGTGRVGVMTEEPEEVGTGPLSNETAITTTATTHT